ncbi:Hypothetical protein R9X50_00370300 [Acrodontium crateriforme]|uniref:Uncharacterized protein n=1 Tax=Acrodontium crateriforme TaxID=150365 RepID=A0AAQ3M9K7_9PEZI|nr:Hypothetical protein R9X50_00370300 [Acrodontium crateriforme]
MVGTTLILKIAIALLMIDAIIELSFISSMVAWLHRRGGGPFEIDYEGSSYSIHGKPLHLLTNQGHTSNGASGTAFVLIGIGGFLALWLRSRIDFRSSTLSKLYYHFWMTMTVLSAMLSFDAMVYTFVITKAHRHQRIDQHVASQLQNRPYPNMVLYPLLSWTPENWYSALLKLDLVDSADRHNVSMHLAIMKAWRWNTIPLFLLGLAVAVVAVLDGLARRKLARRETRSYSPSATKGYF